MEAHLSKKIAKKDGILYFVLLIALGLALQNLGEMA